MKVIVIGANGTIGSAVTALLKGKGYEVIEAYRKSEQYPCDITDAASIRALYDLVEDIQHVVCCAGGVHFGPVQDMEKKHLDIGFQSKIGGQVQVVLEGIRHKNVSKSASFTLTSGMLDEDPIPLSAAASLANGALAGFARGASVGMPDKQRVNVVSPTLITESVPKYEAYFPGTIPVDASVAAMSYLKSLAGGENGRVYKAGW